MLNAKRLLDQFLTGQSGGRIHGKGFDPSQLAGLARGLGGGHLGSGSLGGGALAGSLAGILLGSRQGRKLSGSALKMGGMAVIGALAYKAYQDWRAGKAPNSAGSLTQEGPGLAPATGTPFIPSTEVEQQWLGRSLLRAMIAAAKADGHIDAQEQANIFAQMDKLDLDDDDKAFVVDELRAPLNVDAVAGAARNPAEAAEIYTASLLAIDVDNAAERGYLSLLAARLKLDEELVAHLHATVEEATERGPAT
jgi:uncharacterized membrane protein YebE (DUF533 family)